MIEQGFKRAILSLKKEFKEWSEAITFYTVRDILKPDYEGICTPEHIIEEIQREAWREIRHRVDQIDKLTYYSQTQESVVEDFDLENMLKMPPEKLTPVINSLKFVVEDLKIYFKERENRELENIFNYWVQRIKKSVLPRLKKDFTEAGRYGAYSDFDKYELRTKFLEVEDGKGYFQGFVPKLKYGYKHFKGEPDFKEMKKYWTAYCTVKSYERIFNLIEPKTVNKVWMDSVAEYIYLSQKAEERLNTPKPQMQWLGDVSQLFALFTILEEKKYFKKSKNGTTMEAVFRNSFTDKTGNLLNISTINDYWKKRKKGKLDAAKEKIMKVIRPLDTDNKP